MRDEKFGTNLLNTILTVDGLILILIGIDLRIRTLFLLKMGATALGVSLISGILCYQFLVSSSQEPKKPEFKRSAMKESSVAITFAITWITFLDGIGCYIASVWMF